jgi:hypothetical protein
MQAALRVVTEFSASSEADDCRLSTPNGQFPQIVLLIEMSSAQVSARLIGRVSAIRESYRRG